MSEPEEEYDLWEGIVICSICGHSQFIQVDIPSWSDEPILPLECDECHNLTCQPD